MQLELVSLSGVKYSDEAYEVVIPTEDGEIAVYAGHMPLVSLARPGMLSIRRKKSDANDAREYYAILGGVIEVSNTGVRILVDEVEHADELYEDEVRTAYKKAQELKASAKDSIELERAQAMIDRQAVRLKVAELRRSGRRNR